MKPILVTGAHRTGTTWVGKTLALDRGLSYISEPLNFHRSQGVLAAEVPYWYTYICPDNEAKYLAAFQDTLNFKYHLREELNQLKGPKEAAKMVRDAAVFTFSRTLGRCPLLKDPFAVFSIPWFRARFSLQTVIMVRHPLPFVSSLKRLGWAFDFNHLLKQDLLMRDLLEPYREEMINLQNTPGDIIGQGILLWQMIYSVVDHYRKTDSDLLVVRHEDLSLQPLEGFGNLFQQLGLELTAPIEKIIRNRTRANNPQELARHDEHAIRLDSKANLRNWRDRLQEVEIARIVDSCQKEMAYYYQRDEWESW